MLGLLAVLPSALNLPQTTPSETLEYAPVPPEDQNQPPSAAGNFSSLGLGSSRGPGSSAEPGGGGELAAGGEVGGRQVKAPSTKRCVGSPPRQTEDPLSPPCVGFFQGDNGGATYQGVARDEVRVIIMVTGYSSTGSYKGNETTPVRKYYDLAEPAKDDDHSSTRYLRAWQKYFNERYQTYGRFVHFWAYYIPTLSSPEERRADAADNYNRIKPFAVLWPLGTPNNIPAYTEVMSSKGVLNFTGNFGARAEAFRRYPGLNWGFLPSLEEHAKSFSAYICEKVAPNPVEFSGNAGEGGQPRKYGLIYSAAAATPFAKDFVNLVKPRIQECGVVFAEERTHPFHGAAYDGRTTGDYAAEAMAAFREAGITTILWLFGYETNFSRSAAAINYRPEWIIAGDSLFAEGNWNGQDQEQSVWDHAIVVSLMTKLGPMGLSAPCKESYITADPQIPRETLDLALACHYYDELRQLFTGIQVAGARLNPQTMDKGYHAIPAILSKDPSVPACFYDPGDYTCVKDGTVLWYDSTFQDENSLNAPGCWRLLDGGRRYTPGHWPEGTAMASRKDTDPCNGWLGGRGIAA